jgi:hypothetical protein
MHTQNTATKFCRDFRWGEYGANDFIFIKMKRDF